MGRLAGASATPAHETAGRQVETVYFLPGEPGAGLLRRNESCGDAPFCAVFLPTVILALASSARAADVPAADFFVAPDGKDTWSGRLAEPKPDGSDGPLASLTAARDAVRGLKANGPLSKPVLVLLRGGKYPVSGPVQFSANDSGTMDAPITYAAYPGEKAILTGGVPITGWRKGAGPLWTAVIPQVKEGRWYFRSLFVDGKRAAPARTPNEGATFPARSLQPMDRKGNPHTGANAACRLGLRYQDDQIMPWSNLDDAIVVVYHAWTTSRHHIASVDAAHKIVHFTNPSNWPVGWWDKPRYYVENVHEALDAPGEFYLDRKTGVLSYCPRPGEDMTAVQVVAPRPEMLLQLEGDASHGRPIEHLRIEGIGFEYTDWVMPRNEVVDGQSAMFLKTATVLVRGARDCVVERCEIAHIGGYALRLEHGCKDNRVVQCHMHDLGAGGVLLGEQDLSREAEEQSERNEVSNCFIHDGGRVYHMGAGVWIGQSSYNKVLHNEICDFLNLGVSVGWSWGYAPTTAHHNAVEYNHIHHLGYGQLSDMGGVYTLGVSPGTTVRYNLVHDVLAFTYGGWGLYADEGSTDILWENNVVYRANDGCFHQHYGRDNMIRNNILAFATHAQIVRTRDETHRSFICQRNIVYYTRGEPLDDNFRLGQHQFDYNCYWNAAGRPPIFPGGLSFQQWQAKRQDLHSLVADPEFFDAERFDFRLKRDSPALRLGFQPIDTSEIGLTGPAEWLALPKQVHARG